MKSNKFKADHVFDLDNPSLNRQDKLKQGMEALYYHFNIQIPMWFADNEKDFAKFGKAQFLTIILLRP